MNARLLIGGVLAAALALSIRGENAWAQLHYRLTNLGSVDLGFCGAVAINACGQVVGGGVGARGDHAFLYSNGTMEDLNNLISTPGWTL
jgi:probable HAF family extracellular repeat protein